MAEEKQVVKTKRPTALKRDMQSEKRRLANRAFKSRVGSAMRSFEKEATQDKWNGLQALLDKGVKKGIFKINKVGRLKSKYASKVR